jgi:putative ABC transport system permease protein
MTRHLVKLIWNRKRQNLLLAIEILCSFLVLFFVVYFGLNFAANASQPLGFGIDRVWNVDLGRPREMTGSRSGSGDLDAERREAETRARERDAVRRILAAARELPQVELAAGSFVGPYANSTWQSGMDFADGRHFEYRYNAATDDFLKVLSMRVIAGRAFSREDDGATAQPVLLNESLARGMFGDPGSAVGKTLPEKPDPNHKASDPPATARRVVGVFQDFRQHGEYSQPWPVLFERLTTDGDKGSVPDRLLIRVRPGTTASFEPQLVRRLQREAPDWSFEVTTVAHLREKKLSDYTMPLSVLAVVAGFLLLMVALGLSGVVWQSVTQRLREFGLRRATGAAGAAVRRQVLLEMAVMTTFALLAGTALLAQLPLLPLPRDIAIVPVVFAGAVALAAAAIYCLTLACGWYPSRLATHIPPAEALRYE